MKNVLIIGAGQLGSRHLQGAMLSKYALNITVVDPSEVSLELSRTRAAEVRSTNQNTKIEFIHELDFGATIDICIIATTANIRFKVFQNLVEKRKVKNIIFEKVLFQKEDEYTQVSKYLLSHNINAWVNCPRRVFPNYQKIKKTFSSSSSIKMTLVGSGWGLACNGIHFIDLFVFLTGNTQLELDGSLLSEKVIESKRMGSYEVFGKLSGHDTANNRFEMQCIDDSAVCLTVKIENALIEAVIKETEGELTIIKNGNESSTIYQPLYQSQLTNIYVDEIIESGSSSLTTFTDSTKIHMPFIQIVKQHLEQQLGKRFNGCPIT